MNKLNIAIEKYHTQKTSPFKFGDSVLFKGGLYNRGIIIKFENENVHLIAVTERNYVDKYGELKGKSYIRKKHEIIKKDFSSDMFKDGVKYLFCNKFKDDKIGDYNIKWDDIFKKDLLTIIDGKATTVMSPSGGYWRFVEYTKNGKKYLIPGTALIAIPAKILKDCNIGIDKKFNLTDNKNDIVFPLGEPTFVSEESILEAFRATNEVRRKYAISSLIKVKHDLTHLTDKLSVAMRQHSALLETVDLIKSVEIDKKQLKRTKHLIQSQWDYFDVKHVGNEIKIKLAGYIIYIDKKEHHKYNIGYCEVIITYPGDVSKSPYIKISNNNSRDGHAHPFADKDGTFCHGDDSEDVAEMIASGNFEKLSGYLYEFLTRGVGNGYAKPHLWDEIEWNEEQ